MPFCAIYVILNYLYLNHRGIAPGVLDSDVFHIQTLQHIMRMSRTWDATMSMIPKGGETIWGGLDWSPEEGYLPKNKTHENIHNSFCSQNESDNKECQARHPNYGRIISFGRDVAETHSSNFERIDFRVRFLQHFTETTALSFWAKDRSAYILLETLVSSGRPIIFFPERVHP